VRSAWHAETQPQIDRLRLVTTLKGFMNEIARAGGVAFVIA
jgi:hypothetical protein